MSRKQRPYNRQALLPWYSFRGKLMPLWREFKRLADELLVADPNLTPEQAAERIMMEVRVSPLTTKQRAARLRRAQAWQDKLRPAAPAHGTSARGTAVAPPTARIETTGSTGARARDARVLVVRDGGGR